MPTFGTCKTQIKATLFIRPTAKGTFAVGREKVRGTREKENSYPLTAKPFPFPQLLQEVYHVDPCTFLREFSHSSIVNNKFTMIEFDLLPRASSWVE